MFPAFTYNCVLCCRHWRIDGRSEDRRCVHWRRERECGAQETGCCYEKTGAARWGGQHCLPAANSSRSRSRQLLKKAFDEDILCSKWVLFWYYSLFAPCLWLIFSCFRSVLCRSFVFPHSGHRTSAGVSLSLCGGGGKKIAPGSIDDQLVLRNCSVWLRYSWVSPCGILLSELDEVLDKLNQWPSVSHQQQRVPDKTDRSGDDTDVEQPRRQMRCRRTFKVKKGYAVGELAQFFVMGPTDAANKLSEFYWRVCRKDVSVATHGGYEIIRHFQGHRHFARDQRLRLETLGWRVLDFNGSLLPKDELEREWEKNTLAPLVDQDWE